MEKISVDFLLFCFLIASIQLLEFFLVVLVILVSSRANLGIEEGVPKYQLFTFNVRLPSQFSPIIAPRSHAQSLQFILQIA